MSGPLKIEGCSEPGCRNDSTRTPAGRTRAAERAKDDRVAAVEIRSGQRKRVQVARGDPDTGRAAGAGASDEQGRVRRQQVFAESDERNGLHSAAEQNAHVRRLPDRTGQKPDRFTLGTGDEVVVVIDLKIALVVEDEALPLYGDDKLDVLSGFIEAPNEHERRSGTWSYRKLPTDRRVHESGVEHARAASTGNKHAHSGHRQEALRITLNPHV